MQKPQIIVILLQGMLSAIVTLNVLQHQSATDYMITRLVRLLCCSSTSLTARSMALYSSISAVARHGLPTPDCAAYCAMQSQENHCLLTFVQEKPNPFTTCLSQNPDLHCLQFLFSFMVKHQGNRRTTSSKWS
ncbi:hypothetical protein GUJ93_ZPchr0010g10884 [Zizania palustris]|uniref:Uncharacterized protein n=1 Tax=Zizania palustris TaxID=103762 RepID=A0A8J6BFU6_ZIZPA|nr:hypothetical protein GUJ93_ZPchr0010g10884 [Zizania palustris]